LNKIDKSCRINIKLGRHCLFCFVKEVVIVETWKVASFYAAARFFIYVKTVNRCHRFHKSLKIQPEKPEMKKEQMD